MTNQLPSRGPDYGIAKILRGFPNFEDYYQGLSRGIPIALSPYGSKTMGREQNAATNYAALSGALATQVVDTFAVDSAGCDGVHSPNLLDALPTVLGASCVFMLPRPVGANGNPYAPDFLPMYKLIWRTRGIDTFAQTQLPYHANLRGFRYVDSHLTTELGFSGTRVLTNQAAQRAVMMTTEETIRLTSPRATPDPPSELSNLGYQTGLDIGVQPAPQYGEARIFVDGDFNYPFVQGPILPFVGAYSEVNGVTNQPYVYADIGQNPLTSAGNDASASNGVGAGVGLAARAQTSHVSYSTVAKGDEVIVLVYNLPAGGSLTTPGVYDFDSSDDLNFSLTFGRGGYANPGGSILSPRKPYFPNGVPFGVYLIQGHG